MRALLIVENAYCRSSVRRASTNCICSPSERPAALVSFRRSRVVRSPIHPAA
jgi:hypothetical protein